MVADRPGENVRTALRREIYEETGCVCDDIRKLGMEDGFLQMLITREDWMNYGNQI